MNDVGSLCAREVVSIPARASVREAALAMRRHHVGALALTDPEQPGCVIGIVTDRDLVVGPLAEGFAPDSESLRPFCAGEMVCVPSAASVGDAVQAMQRAAVRRLLVMAPDGTVRGLVSLDDLLAAVTGELAGLAATVRGGVAGERARAAPHEGAWETRQELYVTRNEP